jgi:RNA-directed DNA polymerase
MRCVARRISDKHVLHLIKLWLDAAVEEDDGRGNRKRTTLNRDTGKGTPQGAPISPLLSNIYMRRFILGWKQLGHARRWGAHIVNYADDFVICCKGSADEAMLAMRNMMDRLKLTINEAKTHVRTLPQERFDFLGYTFERCYRPRNGQPYIGARPSKKNIRRMVKTVTQETHRSRILLETEMVVTRLNRKLEGWANYFCLGSVSPAYRALDTHAKKRLRRWLCKKHKVLSGGRIARYPDQVLYDQIGLINLPPRTRNLPWAKA